jgi:mevalonate kinase
MVMGEHAVLHGSRAIACAVNQRITFAFSPIQETILSISSSLGTYSSPLHALTPSHDFRFVLESMHGVDIETGGVHIDIESDFSHQVGLGSSAAVTVSAVAGRQVLENRSLTTGAVLEAARRVIQQVQGSGSATDAAASVTGGLIVFQPKTLAVESLPLTFPLTLRYVGYKMPTPEVIAWVNAQSQEDPDRYQHLYQVMKAEVERAVLAAQSVDHREFAKSMTRYQALMRQLGVSDDSLEALIQKLEHDPGIQAVKISGSGLGDCVMGMGAAEGAGGSGEEIPVAMEESGVRIESD